MKIGVIVCSYDKSVSNIKPLCDRLRSVGLFVVVGYDAIDIIPDLEIIRATDAIIIGGTHGGKQKGERFSIQAGLALMRDKVDYVLKLTGDVSIDYPERIEELVSELQAFDVMTCHWRRICGTMIFFGKVEPLYMAFNNLSDSRDQLECKFTRSMNAKGIKYKIKYCLESDKGVWGKIGYKRSYVSYPPLLKNTFAEKDSSAAKMHNVQKA